MYNLYARNLKTYIHHSLGILLHGILSVYTNTRVSGVQQTASLPENSRIWRFPQFRKQLIYVARPIFEILSFGAENNQVKPLSFS